MRLRIRVPPKIMAAASSCAQPTSMFTGELSGPNVGRMRDILRAAGLNVEDDAPESKVRAGVAIVQHMMGIFLSSTITDTGMLTLEHLRRPTLREDIKHGMFSVNMNSKDGNRDTIGKCIALLLFPDMRVDYKLSGDGTGDGGDGAFADGRGIECKTSTAKTALKKHAYSWCVRTSGHSAKPFTWVLVLCKKPADTRGVVPMRTFLADWVDWVLVLDNEVIQSEGYNPARLTVNPYRWSTETERIQASDDPWEKIPKAQFTALSKAKSGDKSAPADTHTPAPHRNMMWAHLRAYIRVSPHPKNVNPVDAWDLLSPTSVVWNTAPAP